MKVCIVTGHAHGIGRELVHALLLKGYVVHGIDEEDIKEFTYLETARRDKSFFSHKANISDENRIIELFKEIAKINSKLDYVYVNAGIGPVINEYPSLELSSKYMKNNFFSAVCIVENSLKFIDQAGAIIFSSSISSLLPTQSSGLYSASKAAMNKYAESLKLRRETKGLTVKIIILGFVDTRMTENMLHARNLKISPSRAARAIIRSTNSRKIYQS